MAVESVMRTVLVVLLDPARDAAVGVLEVLVLVEPHLLFLQAAVEAFDVAVALGLIIRRALGVIPNRFGVST